MDGMDGAARRRIPRVSDDPRTHPVPNRPVGMVTLVTTTTAREAALEGGLRLARAGRPISLESTAAEAGISKPGLMHHFRTKEALMLALVDRVAQRWEDELTRRLGVPAAGAGPQDRLRSYIDWALTGHGDESDLVMLLDPRLREALTTRWVERLGPWLALPHGMPAEQRARLQAARLIADGAWFADASGALPLSDDERAHTRAIALALLTTTEDESR